MAGADREAQTVGGADSAAVLLPASITSNTGANVPPPLPVFRPPARDPVSVFRSVSVGVCECVRLYVVAARMQLPGADGWKCTGGHDGPNMAATVRPTGTQARGGRWTIR